MIGKYACKTSPEIDVASLIHSVGTGKVTFESIIDLANQGMLSGSDLAHIIVKTQQQSPSLCNSTKHAIASLNYQANHQKQSLC